MHRPHLLAVAFLPFFAVAPAAQDWSRWAGAGPPVAMSPAMAYDLQRGRCVLFGGWNVLGNGMTFAATRHLSTLNALVLDQTWEFDGSAWTRRSPAVAPPARDGHGMAYDFVRGRTVLFGGMDATFNELDDTWEWDGTTWQNRLPATAPSPRQRIGLVHDGARGVTVLFGGFGANVMRSDTWEWNGSNWTQRQTASAPAPRAGHAMAYDTARARTVLHGGIDGGFGFMDTWEYDGSTWSQVVTDGGPGHRSLAAMTFDAGRNRCVLFGGIGLGTPADTWEWDGVRWQQVFTANLPQPVTAGAMAYDILRNVAVLYGGHDGWSLVGLDGTWELGGSGASVRTFGRPCIGGLNLPMLEPQTMPSRGSTATVRVDGLPPGGGVAVMVAGLGDQSWSGVPLPLDLAAFGLTGCRAYTSADAAMVLGHPAGTVTWSLAIPNNGALVGARLFLQCLSLDPAAPRPFPAALTGAAELRVN